MHDSQELSFFLEPVFPSGRRAREKKHVGGKIFVVVVAALFLIH